ncbi:DUF4105 domain-containing protein [Pirellulaceae bacterium]|nr:DUF4105 domain-containing protein [Pirellulaceae bacterium]
MLHTKSNLLQLILLIPLSLPGCQSVTQNDLPDRTRPSNNREWAPQFSQLPIAEFEGNRVTVSNVRNNNYITENDFILDYEDRVFDLAKIRGVDFLVCPFQNAEYLAHTMLSFEFEVEDPDGNPRSEFVSVSSEIRTEKGEEYSPILGITNQFELTYVVADEKDLIRLRTRHRNAEVYIYPTIADAEKSKELFVNVMKRINQLAVKPEFYHTVLNNCTTSIVKHVNEVSPNRVPYNYSVLLPGLSAKYAYDLGLLDRTISFPELKKRCNVTELSEQFYDSDQYSNRLRGR